jgi:Subtilase family
MPGRTVRTSRTNSRSARKQAAVGYHPRVVVKFHDWIDIPYEDGAEKLVQRLQLGDWAALLKQFPRATLKRRYSAVTADRLRSLIDRGREFDRSYQPPNFFTYFAIETPPGTRAESLAALLREWPSVETVYIESGPTPPPLMPSDDPRFPNQGYLKKAKEGIDAEYAWTITGGDGTGTNVIDVEYGWMLTHEDLVTANINLISGTNKTAFDHGTASLGVLVAVDNQKGGIGIAPSASTRVVSEYDPKGFWDRVNQMLVAVNALTFGDVLLLEMQGTGNVPAETDSNVFDVIRLATALGIVVVEPAGNSGKSLSKMTDVTGKYVLDKSSADFKDSGAIIVGSATSSVPHERKLSSCYGERVNCYAWGENVDTCSTNSTATTSDYTTQFAGTSSASAIIAGAALAVQGVALATLKRPFSAWQLRAILSDTTTGTEAENPPEIMLGDPGIGVMPDLKAILGKLKVIPDLYLRDFVGDTGDPHKGAINASPDIILVPTKTADPNKTYGLGSGTEYSNTLGSTATAKQDNFIYVRVLNRGATAAANVMATVYYAPVATLVAPNLWTKVGSVTIPTVPGGDILTVSDAITWSAASIPGEGHYCFVGVVGNVDDPAPLAPASLDWNQFYQLIRGNNNVTWRNFNVVNPPKPPSDDFDLRFLAPGAPEVSLVFGLEVFARLPQGAEASLEMPLYLMQSLGLASPYVRVIPKRNIAFVPLNPRGYTPLGEARFAANSVAQLALRVKIPAKFHGDEQELHVSQFYGGVEVGRVTWRLVPSGA